MMEKTQKIKKKSIFLWDNFNMNNIRTSEILEYFYIHNHCFVCACVCFVLQTKQNQQPTPPKQEYVCKT